MNINIKIQILKNKKPIIFWQELFIYFWVFSLIGHYLELFWKFLVHLQNWRPIMSTIMPLAPPYGLGVVAVILFIKPLIKKYNLNPLIVFGMCIAVSNIVEYFCASILVLLVGYNKFWNYSYEPFNIKGFVCLKNGITFGILATLFLYFVYPYCNKFFQKLPKHQFKVIFWIIFLSYLLSLTTLNLK